MTDGSIISNFQWKQTAGGYLCSCGMWTSYGQTHVCYNAIGSYYPSYLSIESGRLSELMEAERKLAEIRRILGDAFG
jgi:hypothetical protein